MTINLPFGFAAKMVVSSIGIDYFLDAYVQLGDCNPKVQLG